jgi:hypothetical protein
MTKSIRNIVLALTLTAASMMLATSAFAQDWPLAGGDYWDVAGIDIKDGGGLKYATWLATEWKKNAEFAKSKGWIKDYKIFENTHPRRQPDYLVRVMDNLASGGNEKRARNTRMEREDHGTAGDENINRARVSRSGFLAAADSCSRLTKAR